jgi:hypothetical protein
LPYTSGEIAAQFMRQFLRENGILVYRRHGRGPAYRVNDGQVQDFLDRYMRRTRISRLALLLATIALGGGGAVVLAQLGSTPGEGMIAAWAVGLVILLVGVFVWAEMRSLTSPERELANTAPVAPAIDRDEWTRSQLQKVPWINFAILPAMGLFIVWAFREDVHPSQGWGRLIWLIPAAMTALAGVQAVRKWRSARRLP